MAKNCKHNLWHFLDLMVICKSHAFLHKVERFKDVLEEATSVSKLLKSPKIAAFLEKCTVLNNTEYDLKKRTQSQDSVRKLRSKQSLGSRSSRALSADLPPSDMDLESTEKVGSLVSENTNNTNIINNTENTVILQK